DAALLPSAAAARARGNLARSAVLAIAAGDDAAARADLRALAARILPRSPDEAAPFAEALLPLARAAALEGGRRAPPPRLLYDRQKAAIDLEREALALDIVGWIASRGRRPLARPLPDNREVRHARHLASACAKLGRLRLADEDRRELETRLRAAAEH